MVAYLDRVNVSFAQLQLKGDLDFSDTIFGIGAGIFSLGYVIFGVPSNLALARFGARRWLAGIMVAWGVISASMLSIGGPGGFYVLRFLLGAAEAGFFPGVILFLTWWFPERRRTPVLALFFTAVPVAYVFGGPISGGLLELDSFAGLDGWQWLFLIEGLPAIALGFVTLRYLDERPEQAHWLEPEERELLAAEVRRELELRERLGPDRVRDALRSGRVWAYGGLNFVLLAAGFGLTFFVPDLVQDRTGYTDFEVGLLAAIPFAFATAAMIAASRRRGGLAPLMVTGAAGTLITAYAQSPLLLTLGITLAAVGLLASLPRFWMGPTSLLSGTAAAAGIALVAVLGNLGGFMGPAFTGIAKDSSGGYELPLTVLAVLLVVTAGCCRAFASAYRPASSAAAPAPESASDASRAG